MMYKNFVLAAAMVLSSWAGATQQPTEYLVKMAQGLKSQSQIQSLQSMLPTGSRVESLNFNQWHLVRVPAQEVGTFSMKALMHNPSVVAVQRNYKIHTMDSPSLVRARELYKSNIRKFQARRHHVRPTAEGDDDDDGFPFPFPGEPGDGGDDDGGFPFPFPGEPGDGGGDDGGFPFPFPGDGGDGGGGGGGFPFPGDPGDGGGGGGGQAPKKDNPDFPSAGSGGSGADPLYSKQWGMNQNKVRDSWQKGRGDEHMIVAVLDTGVDYTHEDLVDNMWHNPGETGQDAQGKDKASNGKDDDNNGYIDDVIGWDFAAKDNKPFDLSMSFTEIISTGGNPGHGTHCAGNVAARADNGKGIVGVAPNIKIMALRFISEKGQGTTADAVLAIKYAVDNGAKVMSNSWGSEGDDGGADSAALKEAIQYAQTKGALFIAAAGNGHQGAGYDNDTDSAPGIPASYNHDIIVSVAAIDENGAMGPFSNWGKKSVDLAAPGVKVFSTVPGNQYQDALGNFMGQQINWDGTSMATPHVAGAAALYWSANPNKTWQEVKAALMSSVKKTQLLGSKTVSGGQLDVGNLMSQ
jgi:thermitase